MKKFIRSFQYTLVSWRRRRLVVAALAAVLAFAVAAPAAISQTYPDGKYPSPRLDGMFDQTTVGGFRPNPAEDQVPTKNYFGLQHTNTFFDAFLYTASGKIYMVSNVIATNVGMNTILVGPIDPMTAAPWVGVYMAGTDSGVPDPRNRPWNGPATYMLGEDDNKLTYTFQSTDPETATNKPEEFSFGSTTFEWKTEDSDIAMTGTLAADGSSFLLPWRDPEGNTDMMFYNMQSYKVQGMYHGEQVTGIITVENLWASQGYWDTWWVQNRIGHWMFFTTTFKDGSAVHGQIQCGEFGARGAIIVDNDGRTVVKTSNLKNSMIRNSDNILYDFGNGEKWIFEAWPNSSQISLGPSLISKWGKMRPLDRKRKVVSSGGWYLIIDHLCNCAKP
ncbi:MAG: hypothetical protein AB2L11_09805 [Syntrophobacteraceae bacterium]